MQQTDRMSEAAQLVAYGEVALTAAYAGVIASDGYQCVEVLLAFGDAGFVWLPPIEYTVKPGDRLHLRRSRSISHAPQSSQTMPHVTSVQINNAPPIPYPPTMRRPFLTVYHTLRHHLTSFMAECDP